MAAATTPLQTLSRRAGNYAPKAAPSPALLGDLASTGTPESADGGAARRGGPRAGTARGGRTAPSARQGQLPFGADPSIRVTPKPSPEAIEPPAGSKVIARETVVIRRREVLVEKMDAGERVAGTTDSGLRAVPKPALRRVVLDDVADRRPSESITQERVQAPRRELPIVLEAVGTVAVTALGLAALLFLG